MEVVSFVILLLAVGAMGVKLVSLRHLKLTALPDEVETFVLYLRPFRPERRRYINLTESEDDFQRRNLEGRSSLDEFLAREAARRIGPVVGLGRPGDREPRPGAYRIYLDRGADWQKELARLADRATAIVMIPSHTASLAWEMRYLCEKQLWPKLFVVTRRPVGNGVRRSWSGFAHDLEAAGLTVDKRDPGPDVVVGFSPQGVSRVVGTARTPADVVDAIEGWVPGRWTGDARVPPPAEFHPVPDVVAAGAGNAAERDSDARSPTRQRTGVSISRPMRPFDRGDLPILAVAGVPMIAWAVTGAIRDGGTGAVVWAVLACLVFGPCVALFVVSVVNWLRIPNIDAMARRGDVRGLVRALWHRSSTVRDRAVAALAERADVTTAITVLESADHENFVKAFPAAASIVENVGDTAVDPLAEAMDGASDLTHVAYYGALVGHPELLFPVLVGALRAESVSTRTFASTTLRDRLGADTVPVVVREDTTARLLAMLRDESDYRVRRAVVTALSGSGSPRVVAAVTDAATTDADDKVRADAAAALLRLGDRDPSPSAGVSDAGT